MANFGQAAEAASEERSQYEETCPKGQLCNTTHRNGSTAPWYTVCRVCCRVSLEEVREALKEPLDTAKVCLCVF